MSTGKNKDVERAGSSQSSRRRPRTGRDMREQLEGLDSHFKNTFKGDDPDRFVSGQGNQGSKTGFVKRVSKKPLKNDEASWYKKGVEENTSASGSVEQAEISQPEVTQEHHHMATEKQTRTAEEQKIFDAGMEMGRAEAKAEFNQNNTEKVKEAAEGFWAKTKATAKEWRGVIGVVVGVAGLATVEAGVAMVKERRGQRSMNFGDTTVSWDTAGGGDGMGGRPQGGQPGNDNAAGNAGGGGGAGGGRARAAGGAR